MRTLLCSLLLGSLLSIACTEAPLDVSSPAAPPSLKADSGDQADRDCRVVLREVVPDAPVGGWHGFTATIDVGAWAPRPPALLYRRAPAGAWRTIDTVRTEGAPDGFDRHVVTFGDGLVDADAPLDGAVIELIPYVPSVGSRLFDHNRRPADDASYVLDDASGHAIARADHVCAVRPETPPEGTLRFLAGWQERQAGALVRGGKLRLEVDAGRLTGCTGSTYNGLPTWGTTGYVRFHPGGEVKSGVVVAPHYPTGVTHTPPLVVDIPRGATDAEVWIVHTGRTCAPSYDSNLGANYGFAIEPAPAPPVRWAGNVGGSRNRACDHRDGWDEPAVLGSYDRERACLFVDVDVWAPGLTDQGGPAEHLQGRVRWQLDGGDERVDWLEPVDGDGGNGRLRWWLPRGALANTPWTTLSWIAEVSTDGVRWGRVGTGAWPDGGAARTITRDASW